MNDTIESESIKVPTDSLMMNNTNTNAECSSVDDIVDVDDNNNADFNPDPVIIQQVLEACEKGDITLVQQICKTCYKSYGYQQDPNTGMSPLMMSSKCGYLSIVEYLLKECSASWNARDQYGLCAGNYATDHQQWDIVNYIVDWATKCELILGMIQRNQLLITTTTTNNIDNHIDNDMMKQQQDNDNNIPVEHYSSTKPNYLKERVQYSADNKTLLDEENDAVMMEWERPIMDLHAKILMTSQHSNIEGYEQENNNQHQQPSMALDDDAAVLPDAAAVAVSNDDDNNTNNDITYERRSVLNIGYGLGIIDNALQQYNPLQHIIIEAHPDVYQRMIDDGWDNKSNVRICYGKWQDVIPHLISEGIKIDSIFYDTYGEHYLDFEDFHSLMIQILNQPHGMYSFFNGLAPDNIFFHGVACNCIKIQLSQLGLDCEFLSCQIQTPDQNEWNGIRRKYWYQHRDIYYLPIFTWNQSFLETGKPTISYEYDIGITNDDIIQQQRQKQKSKLTTTNDTAGTDGLDTSDNIETLEKRQRFL